MTDHDQSAKDARRYPRVITDDQISGMPRMEFAPGIETAIFISRELDDARYFRQGIAYAEPDHDPVNWQQVNFDETQCCLTGMIRLKVVDAGGKSITLEAAPGEHIYLPAGFEYTLEATGIESSFLWTSGPSARPGIVENPDYSKTLKSLRK